MRTALLALVVAIAGAFSALPAQAHGGARVSVGVGFGYPYWGPAWGPWWYPPPYAYYPPAPVVIRSGPVTYIEQGSSTSEHAGWWYYCDASRGYYPYVKECPSGWQRVPPTPPSAQ